MVFYRLRSIVPHVRSHIRHASVVAPANSSGLKEAIAAKIPSAIEEVKEVRSKYGDMQLGTCTVTQAYGGMRSVKAMTYETSHLDTEEGIRFRGYTLPECQQLLPKAKGGEEPLPEALFWLLITGDMPTDKQIDALRSDLAARSKVPQSVIDAIDGLPIDLHPMTQFSIGILAMQQQSVMAHEYAMGTPKSMFWEHCLEDSLVILAQLPEVAARIYRRSFKGGSYIPSDAENLDLSANFARMMGFDDPHFDDLMRLYLTIHADHEGGNVSAHAIRLVGSALSDPYLSLSAGMNGLAGPLHGLANQEVLRWIVGIQEKLGGKEPTHENLAELCWETLNSGKVIPGYGHAVLRKTDPRYTCQREFALKHLGEDEMFKMVSLLYEVVPKVLAEQGKVKNPWPNVDAHSGVLLRYYGLTEELYYTVLFGVSRAIGPLASLVWDRALGLPIERPKSVTTSWIKNHFEKKMAA
ncbi:citrate synthase (mitochondrial) [Gracilaria domingensis]|nr:citrate synthase (mitochondrial) [Gracilaria domingensis]